MISIEDNTVCAFLAGDLDGFFQKALANAFMSVLQPDCPCANNSFPSPSPAPLLRCVVVCPSQNQCTNDVFTPLDHYEPVFAEPIHIYFFCEPDVTTRHPSDENQEGHGNASHCGADNKPV